MQVRGATWFWLLVLLVISGLPVRAPAAGVERGLSLMVLGSGGPAAHRTGRASSGYLVFIDRKPRILLDAGGGSFQRLAASGANIKDLDLILLSHLHIDHTADLSSMIKTVYFHNRSAGVFRQKPIEIIGPAANGKPFPSTFSKARVAQYPSTSEFVAGHYDINRGVERYLHALVPAISGGEFRYIVRDVVSDVTLPMQTVYEKDGLIVKTIAVIHGSAPALAYRIEYKGKVLVYSGDTSSRTDNVSKIAKAADLLVYDTAIMDKLPDGPKDRVFFALHTTPTRIGQVALQARAKTLLLSHITTVTGPRLAQVKQRIRDQAYTGRIETARDLGVYNLH